MGITIYTSMHVFVCMGVWVFSSLVHECVHMCVEQIVHVNICTFRTMNL